MSTSNPPGYWMHEATGVLAPAIEAYLAGGDMAEHQITALRAYLRQWIAAPTWQGPGIPALRHAIDGLNTRAAIENWLDFAMDCGIDPL